MEERQKRKVPNDGKGRPKGIPNKLTTSIKEAFSLAFHEIGGADALAAWAKKHRSHFYTLYARLAPVDVRASVEHTLNRLSYAEERAREAAGTAGLASDSTLQ
jgi:hypothetical protein